MAADHAVGVRPSAAAGLEGRVERGHGAPDAPDCRPPTIHPPVSELAAGVAPRWPEPSNPFTSLS